MPVIPDKIVKLHASRTKRISAVHTDVDHYYIVDGERWEPSVTTYINEDLFEKFDEDQVITKMMTGRFWSKSKYYGWTREKIKQCWEDIRQEASELGLAMHSNLENYYLWLDFNDKAALILKSWHKGSGGLFNKLPQKTIRRILSDYKSTLEVFDRSTPEFALFNDFISDYPNFIHYHIEWRIFDEGIRLAGSVDMIYRDPDNPGKFLIYDWKRSKEIKMENKWEGGRISELAHLPNSNYWHFLLQVNLYKYILENSYKMHISGMFILVLHPNQDEYTRIPIPDMPKEVAAIVAYRKRQLRTMILETFYPPNKRIKTSQES